SVGDLAGNSTTATSAPVNVDRTAPKSTVSAPAGWNNNSVTVVLTPTDNLSGVKATHYILDNGVQQEGTSLTIDSEGDHTLEYWSEDKAGNVEGHQLVHVKIDKTAPTITDTHAPIANAKGWNNTDVT